MSIVRPRLSLKPMYPLSVHASSLKFFKGGFMAVKWNKDVDAALSEAKEKDKPLLLDFSAAPG